MKFRPLIFMTSNLVFKFAAKAIFLQTVLKQDTQNL